MWLIANGDSLNQFARELGYSDQHTSPRGVNRQQQEVIECLRTEDAVLKKKFGKKRILLMNDPSLASVGSTPRLTHPIFLSFPTAISDEPVKLL